MVKKQTKTARILIAEDEKALNQAYQMILKRAGYEVACAFDGEEALAMCEDFKPDLILLDLRMPKVGGIEFLEKFDLLGKHKDVKVIVFSNLDMQREIDRAFELGATKYVLKAWASPGELVKMVGKEIGSK